MALLWKEHVRGTFRREAAIWLQYIGLYLRFDPVRKRTPRPYFWWPLRGF